MDAWIRSHPEHNKVQWLLPRCWTEASVLLTLLGLQPDAIRTSQLVHVIKASKCTPFSFPTSSKKKWDYLILMARSLTVFGQIFQGLVDSHALFHYRGPRRLRLPVVLLHKYSPETAVSLHTKL